VVIHRDAPDGVVIRRIAVTHAAEAMLLVDHLRSLTLRTGVAGIAGTLAPLVPRGSFILHGQANRYQYGAGSLDAGPVTPLCAEFWALPGTHRLQAAFLPLHYEPERLTEVERPTWHVQVQADATVHLRFGLGFGSRLKVGRPFLHRCKIRSVLDPSESATSHAAIDEQ
jgi:hypothetical protein